MQRALASILEDCAAAVKSLYSVTHPGLGNGQVVFGKPVDAESLGLIDYHEKIKKPMDLGLVLRNINKGVYRTVADVSSDVKLIFTNCATYNGSCSVYGLFGMQIMSVWESKLPELHKREARHLEKYRQAMNLKKKTTKSQAAKLPMPTRGPAPPVTAGGRTPKYSTGSGGGGGVATALPIPPSLTEEQIRKLPPLQYHEKELLLTHITNLKQVDVEKLLKIIRNKTDLSDDARVEIELGAIDPYLCSLIDVFVRKCVGVPQRIPCDLSMEQLKKRKSKLESDLNGVNMQISNLLARKQPGS